MIQKKHQRIISILSIILITGSLLIGCSSSQPVSQKNVLTTQQQNQEKVDAEKKAKEETELKTKQAEEQKLQEEAKLKAQLEAEQKARKEAEEKAKKEAEARVKAEAELKAQQEAVQKTVQAETQKKSITVYVTKTGEKYHRDGCRYLSKSKIPMSLENAKMGYSPCSVCSPPR